MQWSQILWAAFHGAHVSHESPDRWTITGAGLTVASGLCVVSGDSRRDVSANRPVRCSRMHNESGAVPRSVLIEPESKNDAR